MLPLQALFYVVFSATFQVAEPVCDLGVFLVSFTGRYSVVGRRRRPLSVKTLTRRHFTPNTTNRVLVNLNLNESNPRIRLFQKNYNITNLYYLC